MRNCEVGWMPSTLLLFRWLAQHVEELARLELSPQLHNHAMNLATRIFKAGPKVRY